MKKKLRNALTRRDTTPQQSVPPQVPPFAVQQVSAPGTICPQARHLPGTAVGNLIGLVQDYENDMF